MSYNVMKKLQKKFHLIVSGNAFFPYLFPEIITDKAINFATLCKQQWRRQFSSTNFLTTIICVLKNHYHRKISLLLSCRRRRLYCEYMRGGKNEAVFWINRSHEP